MLARPAAAWAPGWMLYPGSSVRCSVQSIGIGLRLALSNRFIYEHNATEAKPFRWTADPDQIIAARNRGFQTLA